MKVQPCGSPSSQVIHRQNHGVPFSSVSVALLCCGPCFSNVHDFLGLVPHQHRSPTGSRETGVEVHHWHSRCHGRRYRSWAVLLSQFVPFFELCMRRWRCAVRLLHQERCPAERRPPSPNELQHPIELCGADM
ncbi:hypothetical protein ABB37_06942 [Leptomonas pyrrhocoris]|uniref:Uncharacterized protein n=1 Tax=Leptomonas pyrrhocoris TaxID=157538 RepID=A0A0N0VE76_LEPPY|nr:hypothetical protein ABB37_06942 [Leptomonas pyrrhocoris]KPA77571.1 hypothetical protein ABB37_06942 [Leptomonas pyrrhocoris]|eukprot:XP_015656010.1 hypothetical protein ABB37_06942 [Leptomonas pyrrhocoris]